MTKDIIKEDLQFITNYKIPFNILEGKNILVSGANGFLPAYLVETILFLNETTFKKKSKIFALVRNKERALNRFKKYINRPDLIFLVQDVCEPVKVEENIHYIIHAASQASPKYFGKDPVGTLSANVMGTYNLLELARIKKVEGFMFFSSPEIYGQIDENHMPVKEDTCGTINPMNLRSCYAESKRMGETMCVSWFHQYEIPIKIVRPFHVYGPGMHLDDGRVFADFVSDIIRGRDLVIKSRGAAKRSFCYLSDATTGFLTVLIKGRLGEAYNIGNDKCELSIIDLANRLVKCFPEKKLNVVIKERIKNEEYLNSSVNRICPDITKIHSLGWEPKYSIEEGFRRTVDYFTLKPNL